MPTRPLQLSATTLGLYQECPRCFWLHMRAGVKRPARPFPSITRGIDRVVQAACDDYRPYFPPLLAAAIQENSLLDGFMELADPKIAFLRAYGDPAVALVGRLDDVVFLAGGHVAPLDHKSRGSRPATGYSAQYYQLQMDVYALLLQQNGYSVAPCAYLAYYYPVSEPPPLLLNTGFPFGCAVEALPVSSVRAEATYHAACACLAGDCPVEPAQTCTYCEWISAALTYPMARR